MAALNKRSLGSHMVMILLVFSTISANSHVINTMEKWQTQNSDNVGSDLSKALQGAWTSTRITENGDKITMVKIIIDGFVATSCYNQETTEFIQTYGGHWVLDGNIISIYTEFSSATPSEVGKIKSFEVKLENDKLTLGPADQKWSKIDQGMGTVLTGAWLISGRMQDGDLRRRPPGDRKTMKILSGSRFQWIAYNSANGEFYGTGGGSYTAENGTYTENLKFFSRDKNRVGAQLKFQYEIKEKEWHHSGKSSKGDPIYEIWSPRIMPSKN